MHAWQAIQKSLDYIEENLSEDIAMETLARVAALSPFYFQRLFGRLVQKPVNEYLRLRRLARATEALESREKRILDVALECGFSSHASFSRAFRAAYGISPEVYRERPVILNQFVKPDLMLNYVVVDEGVPLIADGVVFEVNRGQLEQPRTFLGISGEVPIAELVGGRTTGISTAGAIWDEFHRQKSSIPHLLPQGIEFGVLYLGAARKGCCSYLAGAEVAGDARAEGYASFTLPPGEYIVCCLEAENFAELISSAVFKAVPFMDGWMKKHGLTCGDFAAEMYYDTDPHAGYMEQWLPLGQTAAKCGAISEQGR